MSKFWNSRIRNITPYTPGEQPRDKLIKINTNENPYPPSPKVFEAIRTADNLQLYPGPEGTEALEIFASLHGINKSQVFITNGSDEALAFSFLAFWDKTRPVVTPYLTYSFYPVYADFFNVPLIRIPMKNRFEVDINAICAQRGGVILANPNAPTSLAVSNDDICRILETHSDDVVLIDEAYADFARDNTMRLIKKYPNLLVIRTMSKSYGLAGLRIGFAAGNGDIIEGLRRAKNSFNSYTADCVAVKAACAALSDRRYLLETVGRIKNTRERITESLRKLGFILPNSETNFLFVRHPDISAEMLFNELRKTGILVRYFPKPETKDFLRITIGTDEEMDTFIYQLRIILNN